jgi:hypothetical protein
MALVTQEIALDTFAQTYEPLPEFPALCSATVSLPLALASEILAISFDMISALVLCPAAAKVSHKRSPKTATVAAQ